MGGRGGESARLLQEVVPPFVTENTSSGRRTTVVQRPALRECTPHRAVIRRYISASLGPLLMVSKSRPPHACMRRVKLGGHNRSSSLLKDRPAHTHGYHFFLHNWTNKENIPPPGADNPHLFFHSPARGKGAARSLIPSRCVCVCYRRMRETVQEIATKRARIS